MAEPRRFRAVTDPELERFDALSKQRDGTGIPADIKEGLARLVATVRSARVAMVQALNALETVDVAARRAAFERLQDEFEGVEETAPPEE
jgi:hypothetical protein